MAFYFAPLYFSSEKNFHYNLLSLFLSDVDTWNGSGVIVYFFTSTPLPQFVQVIILYKGLGLGWVSRPVSPPVCLFRGLKLSYQFLYFGFFFRFFGLGGSSLKKKKAKIKKI